MGSAASVQRGAQDYRGNLNGRRYLNGARELHDSTLGRAGGSVGSNGLLDLSRSATLPSRFNYPIWLGRFTASVAVLPG